MGTVKIANRLVGDDRPCFLVTEIVINHNGNVRPLRNSAAAELKVKGYRL
jgi:sialic acid synthase SpsE